METAVIEMLKRSAAIPSMPQVAARFLELIQDPDFDYRDVVEVLSTDAGTAGEILRLANSSLFGVTRHVSSLPHALTLLGMRRVRSLVLGRYIVDSIDRKSPTGIDISYFWRRSLTCAVLSGQFAAVLEPELREEAFISGLLADVGVIVLEEAMPSDYAGLAQQYRPDGEAKLAHEEVATIGVSHAEASALVLTHWQLPDVVCEAVRCHPLEFELMEASPLARIVGAADALAKQFSDDNPAIDRTVELCRQIENSLQIPDEELTGILLRLEQHIAELAEMLRLKMTSLDTCRQLAADVYAHMMETQTSAAT